MKLLLLLLIIPCLLAATEAPKWGVIINAPADLQIGGDGAEGGAIPQVFIPIQTKNEDGLVFIDLRSYFKSQGSGANISLGYRHKIKKDVIIGGYAALYNHSNYDGHYYSQIAAGVEVFSEYVDASINFYAPLTGKKDVAGTSYLYAQMTGNNFELVKKNSDYMGVMPGMDLNVKVNLPNLWNHELAMIFSVYNFWGLGEYDNVWGVSAALEASHAVDLFGLDSEVFFGMGYDYNTGTGGSFTATAGIKISLGGKSKIGNTKDDIYSSPMMADMPTLGYHVTSEQLLDGYVMVNDNEYSGMTTLTAQNDVAAAVAAAGNDSLVLLSGKDGVITVTEGIVLNEGQSVIGEGQAFFVNGPNGEQAVLIVNAPRATVQAANGEETLFAGPSVFVLNNNTFLANIDINGGETYASGISFNGQVVYDEETETEVMVPVEDVTISDVSITGTYHGIVFNNSKNVTISGVTIDHSKAEAIHGLNNESVYIIDATITNTGLNYWGGEAISLDNIKNLLIKNCQISNTLFEDAIEINNGENITIDGCNIVETWWDAIDINSSTNVKVVNNTIQGTNIGGYLGGTGIEIESSSLVWIEDNKIGETGEGSADIEILNTSDVTIKNNQTLDPEKKLEILISNSSSLVMAIGAEEIEKISQSQSFSLEANSMNMTFENPVNLSLEVFNVHCGAVPVVFDFGFTQCSAIYGTPLTCTNDADPTNIGNVSSVTVSAALEVAQYCYFNTAYTIL